MSKSFIVAACWFGTLVLLGAGATASAEEPKRPWTLLVYGAADNNADGPILHFMDQVRKAIDDDPGWSIAFFIDRSEGYSKDAKILGEDFTGARLYKLTANSAQRMAGGDEFPQIPLTGDVELDSADPANIRRFVAWGRRHFPAERTCLLIYSHADGRIMCPDEHGKTDMSITRISEDIGPECKVDVIALELCNMAGAEIAYQWRPGGGGFSGDYLIAIPNAGPPLDWDRAFARIRTPGHASTADAPLLDPAKMKPEDFGRLVIEEGQRGRRVAAGQGEPAGREAAGCFDLRAAGDVKQAIDALARELAKANAKDALLAMRGPGKRGQTIDYFTSFYVDVYDLCRRVSDCDLFPEPVLKAAAAVISTLDRCTVASFAMDDYDGFEPDKGGLFIVLPKNADDWGRLGWYTPDAGSGDAHGRWSFLRDGATPGNGVVENWFELLDAWFDSDPETGGSNGYRW